MRFTTKYYGLHWFCLPVAGTAIRFDLRKAYCFFVCSIVMSSNRFTEFTENCSPCPVALRQLIGPENVLRMFADAWCRRDNDDEIMKLI